MENKGRSLVRRDTAVIEDNDDDNSQVQVNVNVLERKMILKLITLKLLNTTILIKSLP